jgi:hypothetical protein
MILFCYGSSSFIKKAEQAVDTGVDRSLAARPEEAEFQVQKLKKDWQRHSRKLVLFLDHDDVNSVELEIEEFSAAVLQEDRDVAERSGAKIKALLAMIADKDKLTLRNLL